MFGYITSGEDCVPTTLFNGSSVAIDFSDQSPGDAYTVCVMFRNKDCSAINSTVTSKTVAFLMNIDYCAVCFSSRYNDYHTRCHTI